MAVPHRANHPARHGSGVIWQLAVAISIVWALIVFAALVTAAFVTPPVRRFIIRRAWCVISRHRLQKVFFETRMHTRSGRLSLVLRIHPTQVGERALIWCRAGICFEDFEAHTGEIAAACYAREARIERSKRWAQLVQVNIVRRDTLAAHHVIASGLAAKAPACPRLPGTTLHDQRRLLSALRDARQRKQQADRELRLLLAYAREVVTPRPYRLADLAEAAGMSISGVRVAYNQDDIHQAAEFAAHAIRPIEVVVAALLATTQDQPAREHDTITAA